MHVAKKGMANIQRRVKDILLHHEEERELLTIQLEKENRKYRENMERLYASVGLKGISYDQVKVQASKENDAAFVNMISNLEKLNESFQEETADLMKRLEKIQMVRREIMTLPANSRNVLMALYYPKHTYETAAKILHVDKSTVVRWRVEAFSALCEEIYRKKLM